MFGSRALTDAERNYAPIEAEMTALAWALKKAKLYLQYGPAFKVFTDHKPLISLINKKRYDEVLNNRLLSALLNCRGFTFEAEYIKGGDNQIADCLSRGPASEPDEDDKEDSRSSSRLVNIIKTAKSIEAEYSPKLQQLHEYASNDKEYQMLQQTIRNGFPENKIDIDPIIHQY